MEFARQLAPMATSLVLVARRTERLKALKLELETRHPALRVYPCSMDIGNESARTAFTAWLTEHNIVPDLLINNAGLGDHGDFANSDWARVREMLNVNISALTHLTFLLLPALRRSPRATIINVSSVASFFPIPNLAVYSASKAYVTSFSEALAMELAPYGIAVTALCPGPVPTEFGSVARRSGYNSQYETPPAFVVSPEKAVSTGLTAAAQGRERVVPGTLLSVAIATAMVLPFALIRGILRQTVNRL